MRITRLCTAAVLATGLLLAGCGTGDAPTAENPNAHKSPATSPTTSPAKPSGAPDGTAGSETASTDPAKPSPRPAGTRGPKHAVTTPATGPAASAAADAPGSTPDTAPGSAEPTGDPGSNTSVPGNGRASSAALLLWRDAWQTRESLRRDAVQDGLYGACMSAGQGWYLLSGLDGVADGKHRPDLMSFGLYPKTKSTRSTKATKPETPCPSADALVVIDVDSGKVVRGSKALFRSVLDAH